VKDRRLIVIADRALCNHRAGSSINQGRDWRNYCNHPKRKNRRDNDCVNGDGFPAECPLEKAPARIKREKCADCGCELAQEFGGLELHKPDCENFPF